MTTQIQSQNIQDLSSPQPSQNKYICGCGKSYGSYPAFSTHRKTKHNNETIEGTIIPKTNDPKRGRPSYQFKKLPSLEIRKKNYYQGLTCIELGLLQLDQKYGNKVIRGHSDQFKDLDDDCQDCCGDDCQMKIEEVIKRLQLENSEVIKEEEEEQEGIQNTLQTVRNIGKFMELFTMHMEDDAGKRTKRFLERLVRFAVGRKVVGPGMFNAYYLEQAVKMKKAAAAAAGKSGVDQGKSRKRANNSSSISIGSVNLKKRRSSNIVRIDDLFEDNLQQKLQGKKQQNNNNSNNNEWMNKIGYWSQSIQKKSGN